MEVTPDKPPPLYSGTNSNGFIGVDDFVAFPKIDLTISVLWDT
jgi:hypothetical protein